MSKSEFDIVNESKYAMDWFNTGPTEKSPDEELTENYSLIRLRQSSKKLIKNNHFAAAAQQAYINYVIGGELVVDIETKSPTFYDSDYELVTVICKGLDINRKMSINQMAEMIVTMAFQDGDVLINLVGGNDGLYVELVDASRVRTRPKDQSNPLIREGVEYNLDGSIKGYWVTKAQKKVKFVFSFKDEDFEFFPRNKEYNGSMRLVSDLYIAPINNRIDQSRGVPVLTPIMNNLRYVDQYLEAVLIGARVAACFSAFVKTSNPPGAKKTLEGGSDLTTSGGQKLVKLQPATISYMRPNEEISFASPNRPSDNFDPFLLRMTKFNCMAIRIAYPMLALDLSDTTYSSWKGGSIEVKRNMTRWRLTLGDTLTWVLKNKIAEASLAGDFKSALKSTKVSIRFPKFEVVDEEKTARANRLDLESQVTSTRRISDEGGKDFEELQRELTEEMVIKTNRMAEQLVLQKELEAKYGIEFDPKPETRERGSDTTEEQKQEQRKEDGNW